MNAPAAPDKRPLFGFKQPTFIHVDGVGGTLEAHGHRRTTAVQTEPRSKGFQNFEDSMSDS